MLPDIKFLKLKSNIYYKIKKENKEKLTAKQLGFLNLIRKNKIYKAEKVDKKKYNRFFLSILEKKNLISKIEISSPQNSHIFSAGINTKKLTYFQQEAYSQILIFLNKKKYKPIFLDGITGSGKTEVYFKIIENFLKKEKQVLVLIPEIALSKQWINRFKDIFGFQPFIWNSEVKNSKKKEIWQASIRGDPLVLVGARSSIFLPFSNLGIIIIDEENDISYKQQEKIIYNARDMAIVKSKITKAKLLLISATPSLETFYNCKIKKYNSVILNKRFGAANDPKIKLIDMKFNYNKIFANDTSNILKEKVKNGNQVLILINKRGYAPITICSKCGEKETCPNCDINLVFHKSKEKLVCHHCGAYKNIKNVCGSCKAVNSKINLGYGIEKVAIEVKKMFKSYEIVTLSSDTIKKENFSEILKEIESGKIRIIIGTQIISKGFNFLKLNSVFILDFDIWFNNCDIRTNEKIFQLTQQVSGRTSRKSMTGEVFIQTYDVKNYLLEMLKLNKRNIFYQNELALRKKIMLPPYYRLIAIILLGKDVKFLRKLSFKLKMILEEYKELILLGPIPAPVEFIRNEYRYRILIKTNQPFFAQKILKSINFNKLSVNKVRIKIDVDPVSFF